MRPSEHAEPVEITSLRTVKAAVAGWHRKNIRFQDQDINDVKTAAPVLLGHNNVAFPRGWSRERRAAFRQDAGLPAARDLLEVLGIRPASTETVQ